ncbi:MAG TPA: heme o synthase [Natronosporangium sp.]|nr:heme o synthase [Natronosporangium sp.]
MSAATAQPPSVPAGVDGADVSPVLHPVPVPVAPRRSVAAVVRAYVALTKPRLVELLLVTTLPTMMLAAGGFPPLWLTLAVLVAGALAAGAANAINCYLDRDIDQVMRRTATRPLPAHTVSPRNALWFGITLAVVSVGLMAAAANVLAAALTLGAILYYDLIYTWWLKRTTPHNTVLGGVSGSAPVLIGWAAVTGGLSLEAWLLFALVFLWQPPHFYALALRFRDDYAAAGIPMLSVVASPRRVTAESVVYCWLTVATSLALWPLGMHPLYAVVAAVAGVWLIVEAHRLHRRAGQLTAASARVREEQGHSVVLRTGDQLRPMRLFHLSNTYLTVVFATIAINALLAG